MAPRVRIVRSRDASDDFTNEEVGDDVGEVDTDRRYHFEDDNPDPINIEDSILRDFGLSHTSAHGRGKLGGHYKSDPFTRWGNKITLQPGVVGGPIVRPVKEFLVLDLSAPAEVSIRLSATSSSAPTPGFTITWMMLIGVGSAMQARQWDVPVTNPIGPPTDDVFLKLPVKVLRVSARVNYPANAAAVTAVAQAAPTFPQLPEGVR